MQKFLLIGVGAIFVLLTAGFILVQANRSAIVSGGIERQVGDAIKAQEASDELFEIVISGDTRYAPNLVRHARAEDVLIHEALNVDMMQTISGALRKHGGGVDPERMNLIISVHTPADELAALATKANVERLVLTHLIPPIPANGFVEAEFTAGMNKLYEGDITVARDGMRMDLSN